MRKCGLPKSSHSGFGTCAWNWGNGSLKPRSAPPNLLQHLRVSLLQRSSQCLLRSPPRRASMVLRNSHVPPLPTAFPAPRLLRKPMARSVALPITPSIRRLVAPSAMGPYASCMLRALVIVVPGLLPCTVSRDGSRLQISGGALSGRRR